MSSLGVSVAAKRAEYERLEQVRQKVAEMTSRLTELNQQYAVMLEAQQLLAAVNDENTQIVLDYITGVINRALGEMFPYDSRRIYLTRSLYRGQYSHITVEMVTGEGKKRNLELQSGTGLRQVVSFLFVVALIEVRKGRRLLLMDELLSGMHKASKRIVADIIRIFAEEGFQFIMIEYGMDDLGKLYLVEKPDTTATVTPLGDTHYNDEVFIFNRPVEEVEHEEA